MATQLGSRTVTLGARQLSVSDDSGVDWVVTDVKGWGSPGVRAESSQRQSDHGGWPSKVYLDPRPITIEGSIEAPTEADRDAAVEQLIAAVSLDDTTLTVAETTPKQVTVRRSGEPLILLEGPYGATYSVLVTAYDPRRYSTTLQSASTGLPSTTGGLVLPIVLPITITATTVSGTITLANAGSIGTRPTLTITGPLPSFVIVAARPDGTITQQTYTDALGAGDVLVIDSAARTVTLNGSVSRRRYLSGSWLEIPPNSSVSLSWTSPSYDPSAMLTGSCRSAWM
ncbi:hypothetical protein ACIBEA_29740 [Streptomyces sp. NPDC051555]|uniref:hypothetical protein n=1 Tax=Streptomyces sp. NPDC051555 TaxID=3365657 RepID=UPI0037952A9D